MGWYETCDVCGKDTLHVWYEHHPYGMGTAAEQMCECENPNCGEEDEEDEEE